jgi:Tfp pilus assembly protein PilF
MQKFYQAIPPLNDALNLEPGNSDARLARAVALLNVDKLKAAREDYELVLRAAPKTYPAYYGLADIAYQTKDSAALIQNCQLYLSNAPPNAPEIGQVQAWLKEVQTAPASK